MKKFVHLHVHTEFSLLDGVARISKLVKTTKERGWDAVAITDHGNMYGVFQFFETCVKNNIKPIVGCEFYVTSNDLHVKSGKQDMGHLTLLAKNNEGYKNLLKLNSIAFVDGFYYKPRIDYKTLKEHSKGLICLSGCLNGHIPTWLLQGKIGDAKKLAGELKDMFDEGDFYFEIQNHGIPEQIEVISKLNELSKEMNVKLVGTNDVHYMEREDAEMQDALMCVQMGKTVDDPDRLKFQQEEFYYKTREEMETALAGYEEALDTTLEIAEKCNVILRTKSLGEIYEVDEKYKMQPNENQIPDYVPETGEKPYEFLRRITFEGIEKKYKEVTPDLIERAEGELSLIKELGFVDYFLIVWDYIDYAVRQGIPVGPGRGSGAGSIVAYATGITRVDPIKYGLIFERFIHRERVSMPDFDVDFCMDRRGEVIEYTRQKYGPDHVALIATFGTMQAKNAIRDVARVYRMPYSEVDKVTKAIPASLPQGIKKPPVLKYYFGETGDPENDKYIIPDLRQLYEEDDLARKIINMAIKLEGVPRNTSTHAAGVLISPNPVSDYVPLTRSGDDISTQYNMIELEQLGLLKMDFLGLRTLTDIKKACDYIRENHGKELDFYDMEYDDPKVFELISSGNTDAIFQLESGGMKKFMKDLEPNCMDDIIAGISMYRPGPMDSIPRFVKNKKNPNKVKYAHPCLEPILNMTYGCIVYQEQVMKVFQVMGGYNLGQADNVRRIMSKKKADKMAAEKEKFINGWKDPAGEKNIAGAINLGVPKEVAEEVYGEMASFASYAFNKSHAAAYAYVAYQTAYLKCYFEVEFLTAVLNNRITNADDIKKYVTYAKQEGIAVLPPDINRSFTYFKTEKSNIRFGLSALKHVGIGVIDLIVEEREKNGEFKSFDDFISRVDTLALNKRCLESLIASGAFDGFGIYRSKLMAVYESAVDRVVRDRKNQASGQFSLFEALPMESFNKIEYPNIKEYNKETLLKKEKEIVGVYVSGHPLDDYMDRFEGFNLNSKMLEPAEEPEFVASEEGGEPVESVYEQVEDGMLVTCGGIIVDVKKLPTKASNREMAFLKIEDLYGTIEVTVFPNMYAKFKNIIEEDAMVTVKGKISIRSGEAPSVLADTIIAWNLPSNTEVKAEKPQKTMYLRFNTTDIELYNKIIAVLGAHYGSAGVIIKCTEKNSAFSTKITVNVNTHLINELCGLLGEENIVVRGG